MDNTTSDLIRSMTTHPPKGITRQVKITTPRHTTLPSDLPYGRKDGQPICASRGKELPLRQSSCSYCALRDVKINVWSCDIHSACIDETDTRYRVTGVRKCQECEHYKSESQSTMTTVSETDKLPTKIAEVNPVLNNPAPPPVYSKTFAYGITTIPERRSTTLPITLKSLANAGFDSPILFIDDRDDSGWGLEYDMTTAPLYLGLNKVYRTNGRIGAFGHWLLSLWELFVRNPHADLYCLFQDDIIVSRNLRLYLDSITFPSRGYCNLYLFPSNEKNVPQREYGFHKSVQNGKSATALVFNAESVHVVLSSSHTIRKLRGRNRSAHKSIDGGVVQAFKDCDPKGTWHEYIHNPSLVQHIGDVSTLGNPDVATTGNKDHWKAMTFKGEDFDCMSLLQKG